MAYPNAALQPFQNQMQQNSPSQGYGGINPMQGQNQFSPMQNKPQIGGWDWLFGTSGQNISNLAPNQQSGIEQILGMGLQNFQNPYQGFEPIRQSATSDFFQNIIPQLQAQFSGSGSNSYSSPQLQTNLSSAGAGLAERLAAMQSQYGQQQQQIGLNAVQQGLKPHVEYSARQPGLPENVLYKLLEIAPELAGKYFGAKA